MTAANKVMNEHPLASIEVSGSLALAPAVPTEQTKVCKKCGRILPLSHFNTHNKTADGLSRKCKDCCKTGKKKTEESADGILFETDATPQPGHKATLTLKDFSDDSLFAELRRRGFTGELSYCKKITV